MSDRLEMPNPWRRRIKLDCQKIFLTAEYTARKAGILL